MIYTILIVWSSYCHWKKNKVEIKIQLKIYMIHVIMINVV